MQASDKTLVVLGTGGTIAGVGLSPAQPQRYRAGQLPVQELLAGVPLPPGCAVLTEQVAQIDSKDMELAVWQQLLRRCQHWLAQPQLQGLVVTHGTDTLEETAWLLQALLAPRRPLVLTGAMRPATALDADGPGNLRDALQVAATDAAQGVVVVFAGRILAGAEVRKVHGWRLDAFDAGEAGDLGWVRGSQLHLHRPWPQAPACMPGLLERFLAAGELPRVEIVHSHADAGAAVVDALLSGPAPVQGLVVAATGGGTVHRRLLAALRRAQAQGVRVWRSSRCLGAGAQADDEELPLVGWPPAQARLALALELLGTA